jgi:nitrogen fixation protein FixH
MWKYLLAAAIAALALFAQSKANWKIQYELPSKVLANYDTPLTVKLSDAKGKPVEGAEVETILTMLDMDHGEFKQVAKPEKPGIYKAQQKFVMVGAWQIEVRVKKGGQSASQKFRYEVKE